MLLRKKIGEHLRDRIGLEREIWLSGEDVVEKDIRRGRHKWKFCRPDWTEEEFVKAGAPGSPSATGGVRVEISPAPTANTSSSFLPFNWVQTYKVSPGGRVAAVSNDSVDGTLTVTELSGG